MIKKVFIFLFFSITTILFADNKTVILFTGLPCSGKTTLAKSLHAALPNSIVLDADEVRKTINKDLSFSKEDREENLRRITQIAILLTQSTDTVIMAFVSPYNSIREYMRTTIENEGINFLEIFVQASLKECIKRDVKGMYKKALDGEIKLFTGISSPYENPQNPDLTCNTENSTIDNCTDDIFGILKIANPKKAHAVFIGRWSPFHKGHWEIMKKIYEEDKNRPLLILVRNTPNEYWSAEERKQMVEIALRKMNVPGTVMIIPDIDSVNWGRDVGYTPRMIDVDIVAKSISGTKIRNMIKENDDSWKDFVCPGVDEIILQKK